MNKTKVMIATPCYTGNLDAGVAGRIGMHLYHLGKDYPELQIEWHIIRRTFIHTARNSFTQRAIDLGMDYIWWVDDDCELPDRKDLLPRLISFDKEVVIVPYFLRKKPHKCGVLRASDYRDHTTYKNIDLSELNKGLIEVDGGGTHCMLTKVSMLKKLPYPWFALPEYGGTEDMYMCLKAKECGFKIYCDSDIEAGHVGYAPTITSGNYYD